MSQASKTLPILEDEDGYVEWKNDIHIWQLFTDLVKSKQGPAVYLSLTGRARECLRDLKPEEIGADDGVQRIIAKLDILFLRDENTRAYLAFKEFYNYKRTTGVNITEFFMRFEYLYHKLGKYNVHLPEAVQAFFLINASNLPEENECIARASCGTMTYTNMKRYIQQIFDDSSACGAEGFNAPALMSKTDFLTPHQEVYRTTNYQDIKCEDAENNDKEDSPNHSNKINPAYMDVTYEDAENKNKEDDSSDNNVIDPLYMDIKYHDVENKDKEDDPNHNTGIDPIFINIKCGDARNEEKEQNPNSHSEMDQVFMAVKCEDTENEDREDDRYDDEYSCSNNADDNRNVEIKPEKEDCNDSLGTMYKSNAESNNLDSQSGASGFGILRSVLEGSVKEYQNEENHNVKPSPEILRSVLEGSRKPFKNEACVGPSPEFFRRALLVPSHCISILVPYPLGLVRLG